MLTQRQVGVRRTGLSSGSRADVRDSFICLISLAGMMDENDSRPGFLGKDIQIIVDPGDLSVAVFVHIGRQGAVKRIDDDNIDLLLLDLVCNADDIRDRPPFQSLSIDDEIFQFRRIMRQVHSLCHAKEAGGDGFFVQFIVHD